MGRRIWLISFLFLCIHTLSGQHKSELITGIVSYVTSNNVYVRFDNTSLIELGDTLLLPVGNFLQPAIVVNQKSSSSCVGQKIIDSDIEVGTAIVFKHIEELILPIDPEPMVEKEDLPLDTLIHPEEPILVDKKYKENIRARVSGASYSSLPQNGDARHRMMYRFSMRANNIKGSKFSMESYLNYRQNIISGIDTSGRQNKFFRVYNLAVNYDIDSTMRITVGRKINYKASSLGAIDGVQFEKNFGKAYLGIITGFRPDIFDFGFNPNLLEYGSYVGYQTSSRSITMQSTFGILEQKNSGNIDRRYAYFQHSSTINRKLNVFTSFEADLYNKVNGVSTSSLRLTNLYVALRYRFSRKINVSLSYDARKRIIFYETLRTEVERLLADDETRQGVRMRLNIRPIKYVSVGASFGKRFQSSQQNASDNINAYLNLSKVPGLMGSLALSFNMNTSAYLESKIYSIRHSRSVIQNKLNADFYFRNVNYNYLGSETKFQQNYIGMNLMLRITKKLSFSALTELTLRNSEKDYRINTKLIKRFGN